MVINVKRMLCENLEAIAIIAAEKILASISAGPKFYCSLLLNKLFGFLDEFKFPFR